jgi:hypothetical protein
MGGPLAASEKWPTGSYINLVDPEHQSQSID